MSEPGKPLVKLTQQDNLSGDPSKAAQGFGRVSSSAAPAFDPRRELAEAVAFFGDNGYVLLRNCLDSDELAHLNEFFDRTQQLRPQAWGLGSKRRGYHRSQGLIFSQPLLDFPELDKYTRHRASFPVVGQILGGEQAVRFAEFNFRETPRNAGLGGMNFHHDAVSADRFQRQPYMPCNWLCAIHYLTDVTRQTPAFCVVPKSNTFATLQDAFDTLGDSYVEQPIHAPAGSCVLYDTALYHTRFDGDGIQGRRTWHQYYARGGWLRSSLPESDRYMRAPSPVLTDWNLFPERLAQHPDPQVRLFFSHWNTAQGEWAASGFDPDVRRLMPRGEQ